MSNFISHEPCPNCRKQGRDTSGDNLGVWSDGAKWCFSCGYYEPANKFVACKNKLMQRELEEDNRSYIFLPEDAESYIPYEARNWLAKYDISNREIVNNRLLWSEKKKYLIFPYMDNTSLLAWQGRYFGENPKHPKWYSQGDLKQIIHLLTNGENSESLVLVEDVVSAIRVSRYMNSAPIFGSHIDMTRILRYNRLYESLIIWLDPDKRKESAMFAAKANSVGIKTRVVFSDVDPKETPDDEIQSLLTR